MKAEEIFLAAVEKSSPSDRAVYLDQVCGDDADLRDWVEGLLRAHEQGGSFLEGALFEPRPTFVHVSLIEGPGTVIGPYRLMEQIGEGGMGVVYVAVQTVPVRRKVALKIIKPGMDTKQVIARFEAERQALAMMDHPNIAQVLDAGATDLGRPYFVMELVRGVPITAYCDQEALSIQDRLELFVRVCRAVQHAHQKGIIHRDLKPSNILVTLHDGEPVPKIIDFGVAKATGSSLTDKTVYTAFTQLIGTPLYMSPEQVELSGLDIDTRSDIYSLGVLLYELLTGTTPFESDTFQKAAFDEMRRIIREEEPPKPSTRLSALGQTLATVSAQRKADPRQLDRTVRGDLDWVVMKALAKDRRRRYETASDFAADVMRYLTHQPVQASPASAWYRFRKLARRHRVGLVTSVLVATALLLGTAISTWMAVRAIGAERAATTAWDAESRARQRAEDAEKIARAEAEKAKAINEFLVDDLLVQADPEENAVSDQITLRAVLDRAADKLGARFRDQPLLEAALHTTIGGIYDSLNVQDRPRQHFAAALAIYERESGRGALETANAAIELGKVLAGEGRRAEAEPLLRQGLDCLRQVLGEGHPDTLNAMNCLALFFAHSGKAEDADLLSAKLREVSRRALGEEHPVTMRAMSNYLVGHMTDPAAPAMLARILEARRRALGQEHPDTLASMNNLAGCHLVWGRLAEAEALYAKTLAGERRVLGEGHRNTLITMSHLVRLYVAEGKLVAADPLLSGYQQMRARGQTIPTRVEQELAPVLREIVPLYEARGELEKAAEWRTKLAPTAAELPYEVFARP
jgi:serine/threonine protein kinase